MKTLNFCSILIQFQLQFLQNFCKEEILINMFGEIIFIESYVLTLLVWLRSISAEPNDIL